MHAQRRSDALAHRGNAGAIRLEQRRDRGGSVKRLICRCRNAFQEKREPLFPGTTFAHFLQQTIVFRPMGFEVKTQVEKGLAQYTLHTQKERNKQAPDPAVAIQKRVNRFKLNMQEGGLDQRRQVRSVLMHETLEGVEHACKLAHWRRYIQGVAGTRAADPVLRPPELSWILAGTAPALQELSMHLPDQAQGERKCLKPFQAEIQSIHIIGDLPDIIRGRRRVCVCVCFKVKQVRQGGLCSLDLRGKNSLFPDVHVKKQFMRRKQDRNAVQTPECSLRFAEAVQQRQNIQRRQRRQRWRNKRADSFATSNGRHVPSQA